MRKVLKQVLTFTLCFAMVIPAMGCQKETSKKSQVAEIGDYGTVWSAPSTVKIDQTDVGYENKGEARLNYNTVKNEYESHQLLISANKEVKNYYLESSDLKSGSNVLGKENFIIYNEKYIKMAETVYGNYSLPDALIPIDAAQEQRELKIAKDQNAALWVTVYVPKDTPTGVYEGTFQLTVGKAKMDIPVQVKVNDYVLPETTTGRTLFSWRYDRVGAGELDSSIEMMEYYYEFFLDYRVSLQSLPLECMTREEVIDAMYKYYDIFTTYTIQPEPGKISGEFMTYSDKVKEMIFAIASISGPEKNYFDKAMIYVVDEPDLRDDERYDFTMSMIDAINAVLSECVEEIKADTNGTYDSFKSVRGWEKSILNIPNIMPLTYDTGAWMIEHQEDEKVKSFFSKVNTICPIFEVWNGSMIEQLLAVCEKFNIEHLWWYGAWMPAAPFGNYHIGDKNLLDARSYSWVQAKYGIEGNLYWDAAAYTSEKPNWDQYMNVYENPVRIEGVTAGDGFLAYPGKPYGIYGPIPSVRLMSIRDGMEELEMLTALEKQYENFESTYGSEFSAHDSIVSLIDEVSYHGAFYYADGENGLDFNRVRGALIDSIVWNQMGIGFALEGNVIKNNIANISYYISENCNVYIGEELQSPVKGCKYEYALSLEENTNLELVIETADGSKYEVSRFISFPTRTLQAFNDPAALEKVTLTEGGMIELAESNEYATDGISAHVKLGGQVTGVELVDAAYIPTVSMDTSIFENISNLTDVQALDMDIYNPGETFKFKVKIYYQDAFVLVGEYNIEPGKNTISLPIAQIGFSHMEEAERMVFEFENSADGKTPNQYEFYLDNMIATE